MWIPSLTVPSLTVLLLLRLAVGIITYSWTDSGIIQSAFNRLDEARKNFEHIRRERGDSFPLSERSKEYLETFAEDHASCVQLWRDQLNRFENSWFLYLRSGEARTMLYEDLTFLETFEEKWASMLHDVVQWGGNPVTGRTTPL